jgi:hypothetical protein
LVNFDEQRTGLSLAQRSFCEPCAEMDAHAQNGEKESDELDDLDHRDSPAAMDRLLPIPAAQRIAAKLPPAVNRRSIARPPPACTTPDRAAAGQGRRTPPPAAVSCSRWLGRMRADQLVARYDSSPYHALAVVLEAETLVHGPEVVPKGLAVEAQVASADGRGVACCPAQKLRGDLAPGGRPPDR